MYALSQTCLSALYHKIWDSWISCLINYCLIPGLIDNDEKLASFKKTEHTKCKTKVQNHAQFETKMTKLDTLFLT